MVLPIRHAELMSDLTEKESAAFLKAADKCLTILSKKFDEPPLFVVHGWEHRTQPHLHAHVLPSKLALRDLLALSENTPQRIRAEKERLTKMADEIRPLIS